MKRLTQEEIINRFNAKHKYFYDYRNVIYKTISKNVLICCPFHGLFKQKPKNHMNGQGCRTCGYLKLKRLWSDTTRTFIEKAEIIGCGQDSYEEVIYKKSSSKVRIRCLKHGIFEITPNNYLRGSRCAVCREEYLSEKFRHTREIFITNSKKKYGADRYNYEKTIYNTACDKIIITCNILDHGDFKQTPANHLFGFEGCSKCAGSLGEKEINKILEKHNILFKSEIRLSDCRNKNPLSFDFGILNHCNEIMGFIEYQGEQHYNPVKWSYHTSDEDAKNRFEYIQNNDLIKQTYCKTKNIPFLVIPHWEKHNIEILIKEFLKI